MTEDSHPRRPSENKSFDEDSEHGAFPFTAANLGILMPPLAIVLVAAESLVRERAGNSGNIISYLEIAASLIISGGIMFAVVALLGTFLYGRKGLFTKGVLGLVLSGSVGLILIVDPFSRHLPTRKEIRELVQLQTQADSMIEQQLENPAVQTDPNEIRDGLEQLRKNAEEAAGRMTGDAKRVASVHAGVTRRLEEAMGRFAKQTTDFDMESMFELTNVKQKSVLAERKQEIDRYIRANAELREFLQNIVSECREESKKAGLSEWETAKFIAGVTNGRQAVFDTQVQIRDSEEALCQKSIELLSVLEDHWGKWSVDPVDEIPVFESDDEQRRFDTVATRLNELLVEQDENFRKLRKQQSSRLQQRRAR